MADSSWQWANPNEYIHEASPDGNHTLILGCSSSMWYDVDIDESNGMLIISIASRILISILFY